MTLGERMRACRRNLGQSLKTLSVNTGFSIPYLSDIERGKRVPPVATVRAIAVALGVRTNFLLGNEGDIPEPDPEWRITGRAREIVESTVKRAQNGEWISIDPIFLQWLWADFLKLEAMTKASADTDM